MQNARHGDIDDQNGVLKWMVSGKSQEKVMNLAQSIVTYGFIPFQPFIVIPIGGDGKELYTVVEGNRRIAALKMLRDPDKCPEEHARKKFRNFQQNLQHPLPPQVECFVYPDLQAAAPLIKLRHSGEQGGAGIVPWGAKESEYFAKRIGGPGRYEPAMRLLEYATKKRLISQEESNRIPITNVTRLINSPYVRKKIGLDITKGELTRIVDQDYFDKAVSDMLRALTSVDMTVSQLKSIRQREDFIDKMEQEWGPYEASEKAPLIPDAPEARTKKSEEKADEKKKKQTSRDSLRRKTAIPSSVSMKIQNKRLLKIFIELKGINIEDYINAASVLTRVFIEGCIDLYLEKNNIQLPKNQKYLKDKGRAVRKHLISTNVGNTRIKDDLKGLEIFYSDASNIGSANTFNAIVHNLKFSLTPRELKMNWDRLESCLPWFQGHI